MVGAPKRISKIDFGVLSPDEIRKMSVIKIITADTYDEDGYPIERGLMDPKLGVIDPGLRCKTCGGRVGECPGHFGHIELAAPVIHAGYAKQIYEMLRGTCHACNKILLSGKQTEHFKKTMEEAEKNGEDKWVILDKILQTTRKAKKCLKCGTAQKEMKFEKPTTLIEDGHRLTPSDIRDRLEKIPNEDAQLLGIDTKVARPEWMVLTVLTVPPVTVRPSITLETGERSEDDLTHKLVDILRINQRLRENREAGAPQLIIEDLWELLQYHITTYFDNEVSGVPPARHRSGRPLRTLAQRLKGKEGRFRSNLSGKRVNFSARTVISPDPNISINEVGVPEVAAKELTVPEKVTSRNIEALKQLIIKGPNVHPGANYVLRPDDRRIKITDESKDKIIAELAPGYTVERHLANGDLVLFNRQPSLHRMSIMAHEVKIMPYKTFRLNLCVCVAPETKLTLDGFQRPIEQLKNCWKESQVITYKNNQKIFKTSLSAFWSLKPKDYGKRILKINTNNERELIATEDHPIYTIRGLVKAGDIKIGDRVIVYPIEFPEYEDVEKVILTENDIVKSATKQTYVKHLISELKKRNLLPLALLNNPKALILTKLLGHIFGDGALILKDDVGRAVFRSDVEDLEDIQNDIRMLGFEPGEIKTREYNAEITTYESKKLKVSSVGSSFEVRNKAFATLMKALGAPNGDKVLLDYKVPKWILESPKYVKKVFLAAYFGSELTIPALRKNCKKLFRELVFKISKIEDKINYADDFIKGIEFLLKEFGISISSISRENGNIRKDGKKTKITIVALCSDLESAINFFGKIGYIYNRKADSIARLAYQYLKFKKEELKKRKKILSDIKVWNRKSESLLSIARRNGISVSTLYNWRSRGVNEESLNTSPDFLDFDEWLKTNCYDVKSGLVIEKVISVKDTFTPYVYDITTTADTHNFIANGFLTGNCPPYNADFDGDEMNLHVMQGEEAQAEARILMRVQEQILSPRFGGPIIGGIHDHISGAFILTRKETAFTKGEAYQLLRAAGIEKDLPEPAIKERKAEYWTGKQLFSMALPEDFNLSYKAKFCTKCEKCLKEKCQIDAYVVIKNGQLICGVMDEKSFGAFAGDLLDRIVKDYGTDVARQFLDSATKLVVKSLMKKGFSVGIDEEDIPTEAKERIEDILDRAKQKVNDLIDAYKKGELEPLPGRTLKETLEMQIMRVLGESRDKTGKIASEYLGLSNHAVLMAKSGARGSMLNLTQMAACVGQQAVRGERIHRGYRNRTLPYFKPGDLGAEAHGFVRSNYKSGLNPLEFFFHSMGGREGLVDTAVRTSQSGYMQRRLINALQDLKVEFDGTVRDNRGVIIQFSYGEDGIDPSKSDWGKAVNVYKIIEKVLGPEAKA
ncbi:MAG: hypothetical protein HY929_08550 [Euryarchaeota archaeon]|nr:hypothetical protein [Euryarchaeota archaeon]